VLWAQAEVPSRILQARCLYQVSQFKKNHSLLKSIQYNLKSFTWNAIFKSLKSKPLIVILKDLMKRLWMSFNYNHFGHRYCDKTSSKGWKANDQEKEQLLSKERVVSNPSKQRWVTSQTLKVSSSKTKQNNKDHGSSHSFESSRRCFKCQGFRHFAADCPNRRVITIIEEDTTKNQAMSMQRKKKMIVRLNKRFWLTAEKL